MQNLIVETAARCYMSAHASEKWQFIQTATGFIAQAWFDVDTLDATERAAYEADEAKHAAAEAYFAENGPPAEPPPVWPTLALAKQWAALEDFEAGIDDDLRAFNAPSECYADAYRGFDERRDALLAQAVR